MKCTALLPVLWLLLVAPAEAALRLPHAPPEGQHVSDLADVISWSDEAKIQELGQKLQAEMDKQLVVVTIRSMAEYGGAGMRIEDFAARLFQQWNIGRPDLKGYDYNRGILLVVSVLDRQSRIELGSGWRNEKDADSARIMRNLLIPAFKDEDYSGGLASGAHALDRMARDLSVPGYRLTFGRMVALGAGGALVLASVVSMVTSGTRGWGWNLWRAIFSVLWWVLRLLFSMLTSSSHRRRGHWHDTDGYCYRRSHHHHHDDSSGVSWLGGLFSSSGGSSSHSHRGSSGGGSSSGGSRGGGASGSW